MHPLTTIGYAHKDTQATLDQFIAQGGQLLDVRKSTFTKVPGFTLDELKARYRDKYLWVGSLGNANHHTGRDIALVSEDRGLTLLDKALARGSVCIMCGCKWVDSCHRLYIANRAQERNPGLEPVHLLQSGREGMIKFARAIPLGRCAYMVDGSPCLYDREYDCKRCRGPICDVHAHAVEGFFTDRGYPFCPVCYEQYLDEQARY